jgi:outer membrane protein TolC
MMNWKWLLFLVLVSPLSACMVGVNYSPPLTAMPRAWEESSISQPAVESRIVSEKPLVEWWRTLNVPQLVRFVELTVQKNYDLRIAVARVCEARALRNGSAAGLYPQIDSVAGYSRLRGSENAFGPNAPLAAAGLADLEGNVYRAGFDAGWEIDIFGGTRREVEGRLTAVEDRLVISETTIVTRLIQVYKALGGGWEVYG